MFEKLGNLVGTRVPGFMTLLRLMRNSDATWNVRLASKGLVVCKLFRNPLGPFRQI